MDTQATNVETPRDQRRYASYQKALQILRASALELKILGSRLENLEKQIVVATSLVRYCVEYK